MYPHRPNRPLIPGLTRGLGLALCTLALALSASATSAQTTSRNDATHKLVAPFPAGGSNDFVARQLARYLGPKDVTWIVENRPGANGNIGAAAMAQAAPDGRNLLVASDAIVTVNPFLYKNATDPKSLDTIAMIGTQPSLLVVPVSSPIKTLADFVAAAKRAPLNYASGGVGSAGHLTMEYFSSISGLNMTHVPFTGGAPAMTSLIGAQTDAAFVVLPGALPHVQSGRLRAVAISSLERHPQLPDTPTVAESGFANFDVNTATMIMLPAATPDAIKTDYEKRIMTIVANADFQKALHSVGITPALMNANETKKWLNREKERWASIMNRPGFSQQ